MDLKGSDSLLISSQGVNWLTNESGTDTPTTKIPQILFWHHHMVPLKNWTKIQNRIGECDLLYFIVSPCFQNP
jgi:hypothetical protein